MFRPKLMSEILRLQDPYDQPLSSTPGGGINYPMAGSDGAAGTVITGRYRESETLAQLYGLPESITENTYAMFDVDPMGYADPFEPKRGRRTKHTVHGAMTSIANLPPAQVVKWKNAIYDSGLYDPGLYSRKIKPRQTNLMDSNDISAFQELWYIALRAPTGTTVQDVLSEMSRDNPYSAKNGYGEEPERGRVQTVSQSDPATIKQYARAAATELLGRDLDDDTLNRLVGVMQTAERHQGIGDANKVNAAYEAAKGGGDQTVMTQQVDVGSRTEEQIRAENPGEVEAKGFANHMDSFFKLISGGM